MSVFQDTFTSCLCVFHHTVDLALRYLKHCDQVGIQNSWGNKHCSSIWSLHSPRHIQHDSQTRHIQHEHMHVCRFARAWVSMCVSLHVHGCPCVGRRSVRVVHVGECACGWVGGCLPHTKHNLPGPGTVTAALDQLAAQHLAPVTHTPKAPFLDTPTRL